MYEIYATDMEFEQCTPHKERIRVAVPYTVIHYVLSGSGSVNGRKVTGGHAFATSVNSYIDYYPDPADPWSYIYIRLYGEGIKKAFDEAGFEMGTHIFPFAGYEELKSLLTLHKAISASDNREGGKLIANALFMLHKKADSTATMGVQERNARMIRQYLDKNYYKKITVADVAAKFHLSKNYMRNLFVKYFEVSPKKYLQDIRMERASALLLETDLSIGAVALSVGYEDALLFSKMFARHFSLPPQKYRQQKRDVEG